ncbi:hypothetical protein EC844_103204 [Acinetobacter calcoaceticus]|uniref:Uncharacterized protein n=1 Tax=Acinetobacter calcoaceticus TaxID=471 RepID=A0A4R1XX71_ACICA|nr:hypothetical protein EC844_103204 [Acinetobacter calcoaceticus]
MQTSNHSPDQYEPDFDFEAPESNSKQEQSLPPKASDPHKQQFIYALISLVLFALVSLWVMQNSVNAYFQQTYHQPSPLAELDDYTAWTFGGEIGNMLYAQHDEIKNAISTFNDAQIDNFNQGYAYTPEFKQQLALKKQQEQQRLALEAEAREKEALLDQFSLSKTDQIFFAGDSLMQGVAPFVQKHLLQQYEIKSVNLSKQSTGLSYPSFFNWPQTIKDTLASNPQIKILVVFLGPNDPWDIPNPQGGAYLKFKSPEWESIYRSHIAEIIQNAQQHNVKVMWLSPPNMRKDSLNDQMIYLNQVISSEVEKHHAFSIDARSILGTPNNVYSDYLIQDGVSVKMRTADGIHFSTEGQKTLAKTIEQHIKVVS